MAVGWQTVYNDGDVFNAAILNKLTGHKHDGASVDGSLEKIDLGSAAEVKGLLPVANQSPHTHGAGSGNPAAVDLSGSEVTGLLPGSKILDAAISGAFTFSGFASGGSGNYTAVKSVKNGSGIISLFLEGFTGVSNDYLFASTNALPVGWRPLQDTYGFVPCIGQNLSSNGLMKIKVSTAGVITAYVFYVSPYEQWGVWKANIGSKGYESGVIQFLF